MACHSLERRTDVYAVETIENEGLAYAVQHYVDGDCFANPDTARLWSEAARALNALEKHLGIQE